MKTWTDDTGITHILRLKTLRWSRCVREVPPDRTVDWIDDPSRVPTCLACIGRVDGRLPYETP